MREASYVVHLPGDIAAALTAATPNRRKLAAAAACAVAMSDVPIEHPAVAQALAELQAGRKLSSSLSADLRKLAEALEARYLHLLDKSSDPHHGVETAVFSQARLVACLLDAAHADLAKRAMGAVYEAIAASGDAESVARSVRRVLQP